MFYVLCYPNILNNLFLQGQFLNMIDKVENHKRDRGDLLEHENNYTMFGWGSRPPAMGISGMNNRRIGPVVSASPSHNRGR